MPGFVFPPSYAVGPSCGFHFVSVTVKFKFIVINLINSNNEKNKFKKGNRLDFISHVIIYSLGFIHTKWQNQHQH